MEGGHHLRVKTVRKVTFKKVNFIRINRPDRPGILQYQSKMLISGLLRAELMI